MINMRTTTETQRPARTFAPWIRLTSLNGVFKRIRASFGESGALVRRDVLGALSGLRGSSGHGPLSIKFTHGFLPMDVLMVFVIVVTMWVASMHASALANMASSRIEWNPALSILAAL